MVNAVEQQFKIPSQRRLISCALSGLRKVLQTSDSEKEQRLLLDLFVHVAQQGFSADQLKLFLSLFQEQNAPIVSTVRTSLCEYRFASKTSSS